MTTTPPSSRTAEDFFDREYHGYATYTIENRAIPSMVDGFKPSQRKIAFAANKLWRTNDKALKVFQLGGQAAAIAFYHHGSLDETIIGMAQDFKNSMPIFQGIGQFGSLRAPTAGAPRYVGVKFSGNFRLLYRDFNLLTPQHEEGEEIEPRFFLPVIPTVLLNGTSGIAVGFATKILNRHPLTLVDACEEVIRTGACTAELKPWYKDFSGPVELKADTTRTWVFSGIFTVRNTTTVEITEIPPNYTYEKYEAVLDRLVEDGTLVSYDDASSDRVSYTLKFTRRDLKKLVDGGKLPRLLKMTTQETENLTTLDEHGKLRVFETAAELVETFVGFRMGYYVRRKEEMVKALARELLILQMKAKFVKAVIDGHIKVANVPKAEIVEQIRAQDIRTLKRTYDYLLTMPIYSLTREKYEALMKQVADKKAELRKVNATEPRDMYLTDLAELRKAIKKAMPDAPPEKKRRRRRKPASAPKATPKPAPPTAPETTGDDEYEGGFFS